MTIEQRAQMLFEIWVVVVEVKYVLDGLWNGVVREGLQMLHNVDKLSVADIRPVLPTNRIYLKE